MDSSHCYRFHVGDFFPYRSGLRFSIQHGADDDVSAHYEAVTFQYRSDEPAGTWTDSIDVGNPSSEDDHGYKVTSQTWMGERTFCYPGENDTKLLADNGRAYVGSSSFTLAIDSSNRGLLLRRRLDYWAPGQRARVEVDGALAGYFYTPGATPEACCRWRDEDLLISESLTAGKSKIGITIIYEAGTPDFNEFRYDVMSLM